MTTYEAVPNTDGQILVPVSKKQYVVPKSRVSRHAAPPRCQPGSGIPSSRYRAPLRPVSPPVHRPVSKSRSSAPRSFRSSQNCFPRNHPSESLEVQEATAGRLNAVNSRAPRVPATIPHGINQRTIPRRLDSLVSGERKTSVAADHRENVNKMSLSYIMRPRSTTQVFPHIPKEKKKGIIDSTLFSENGNEYIFGDEYDEKNMRRVHMEDSHARQYGYSSFPTNNHTKNPVILNDFNTKYCASNPSTIVPLQDSYLNTPAKLKGVENVVRNFEFGQKMETAGMVAFRASRKLPPLPTGGGDYHQNHSHMMTSSPFALPHSEPKTVSPSLSTLEHSAVTTLAILNHRLDSVESSSIPSFTSINKPQAPVLTYQSLAIPTRKRPSSLISTLTPTHLPESKSPISSPTTNEFRPTPKRICIKSMPTLTSSSLPTSTPAPVQFTARTQITSPSMPENPDHHIRTLIHDSDDSMLTPPLSEVYSSPPLSPSPSLESPPIRTIPRPLIPRIPLPGNPNPTLSPAPNPNANPNPKSHLLFFNQQVYSPFPRASSAPPPFSYSSCKALAYRA